MEFTLPHDRQVFQHPITVLPADIDEQEHVNNVVYVRWVQEVAAAHWNSKTDEATRKANPWVVVRHEIDYKHAARLTSKVIAYTWVGDSTGPKSDRFVKICDAESGKVFIQAKTTWCLLDSVTGRPKRVPVELDELLIKK